MERIRILMSAREQRRNCRRARHTWRKRRGSAIRAVGPGPQPPVRSGFGPRNATACWVSTSTVDIRDSIHSFSALIQRIEPSGERQRTGQSMKSSPTRVKALTTRASNSMQANVEREKDRLKLLLDMTNALVSNLEFHELLRAISASIRRVMQCDSVGVWLPDSKQGQLRAHALEFLESKGFAKEDLLLPVEGSLIGSVFKTGKPLVVGGKTDYMSEQVTPEALAEGLVSGVGLPLISRNRTLGVLTLASRAENSFSPEDIDFLVRAAGQVAIAIENANLYSNLQRSEASLARGQSTSQTGSFGWNVSSGEICWSDETYNIFQHDRAVKPTLELVFQRIHPDDRDRVQQALDHATNQKTDFNIEHRLLMPDGSLKHVHVLALALETSSGNLEYVGAVTDVTAIKQAEQT